MKSYTFFMTAVVLLLGAAAAYPQTIEQMRIDWKTAPVEVDTSKGSGAVDRHARAVLAGDIRPALEKLQGQVGNTAAEVEDIREDVDALKAIPPAITMPASPGILTPQKVSTPAPTATSEPSAPTTMKEEGAKMSPWDYSNIGTVWYLLVFLGAVGIIVALAVTAERRRDQAQARDQRNRMGVAATAYEIRAGATMPPWPQFAGHTVGRSVRHYRDGDGLSIGSDELMTSDWNSSQVTRHGGAREHQSPLAVPVSTPAVTPSVTDTATVRVPPLTDPNVSDGDAET